MIKQEVSVELYKLYKVQRSGHLSRFTEEQRKEYQEGINWDVQQKWMSGEELDSIYDDLGADIDYTAKVFTFSLFTNKGKLSKQDKSYSEELAPFAEEAFQEQMKKNEELKIDQKRADELAKVVNEAMEDYEDGDELKTVSTKISRSKWYENAGELHSRSMYHKMVPTAVFEEAKELQDIRRKHQRTKEFDFWTSFWLSVEVREADHPNDY